MKNLIKTNLSGDIRPTQEQQSAIDLFKSGGNLAIEAGAGTGKTSTLKLIADSTKMSGQYLAFNKSIVVDSSEKFPSNVKCQTAHSLAWGKVVGPSQAFKDRLNAPRQKLSDIADTLGVSGFTYIVNGQSKFLTADRVAAVVNGAVYNFCCSADREVTKRHMPFLDGLDEVESWTNHNALGSIIIPLAQKAWDDVSSHKGKLQFKHEHYLKIYQLNDPVIKKNFILFDEAQDANPVMLDIVNQQDAQLIFVGDSNQQIYEFTGAINAMASLDKENTTYLTKSFRFGDVVANAANQILDMIGSDIKLIGYEKITSAIGYAPSPDCILVRTNAGAVNVIIAQLMLNKKVGYVGDVQEIIKFVSACNDLQQGRKTFHPELMCFDSWDELVLYAEMVDDRSLTLMIKLINQYTAGKIISSFSQLVKEKDAAVVVSTAHKAKGREWNSVRIYDDFPDELESASPSEQRLMYVAVTRAQKLLDVSSVNIFDKVYQEMNNEG